MCGLHPNVPRYCVIVVHYECFDHFPTETQATAEDNATIAQRVSGVESKPRKGRQPQKQPKRWDHWICILR
jgi:hypothetical protein